MRSSCKGSQVEEEVKAKAKTFHTSRQDPARAKRQAKELQAFRPEANHSPAQTLFHEGKSRMKYYTLDSKQAQNNMTEPSFFK